MLAQVSSIIHNSKTAALLLGAALLYCMSMLGLCAQSEFTSILVYGLTAFMVYFTILRSRFDIVSIFIIGLLCRVSLVVLFPGLSDDIYRFIWDGRMINNGFNPYSYLPSELLQSGILGLDEGLYNELNSPNYYTIYPPVSQFIFWLSVAFTDSIETSSVVLKSIFVFAEIATFVAIVKILKHMQRPLWLAAIYWLNPLILIEGVGNIHFEIIMIAFLAWAIYHFFVSRNLTVGAALLALSVAAKLLPLMFLPFILFRFPKAALQKILTVFTGLSILLFLPIFLGVQVGKFASSIDLYFQKFEFNASVYYLLRHIGELLSGYNLIYYLGPLLGIVTVLLIVRLSRKSTEVDVPAFMRFCLYAFCTYLILATTIHPWYLCIPVFCSVFLKDRFALVWSAVIGLTYINYSYPQYNENLVVVAFEYGLVAVAFLFEYLQHKKERLLL